MVAPTEYRCDTCDWSVEKNDRSPMELSKLAIDHFVETGHSVYSDLTEETSVLPPH
ncbi:hypothetical protein [Halegenticoccus soli]|uniref:hypothetical protein n=1 Tax=Halegenticoccus soli TaxID=1985678 RepID=UPI001303F974|nr:hypothetical protein [Halegenticoccus soli]